jgi:hypothetical protein
MDFGVGKMSNMLTDAFKGTFARVWLARLANPKKEDDSKVFALKILRKVDGKWISYKSVRKLPAYFSH